MGENSCLLPLPAHLLLLKDRIGINYMGHTTVKLSNEIMNEAGKYALTYARSVPMQIEHWARIGKIAEENPDLPYGVH